MVALASSLVVLAILFSHAEAAAACAPSASMDLLMSQGNTGVYAEFVSMLQASVSIKNSNYKYICLSCE